jgi:hypothetical protein
MAEVPVTINCIIYPKTKGGTAQPYPAVIVGQAWVSGLGVGGGPVVPPEMPGVPPGVPTHPIVLPPPGTPTHPIVIPEPPPEMPTVPSEPKPPPPGGGWGWHPDYGWGYFPGPGQPGPKR